MQIIWGAIEFLLFTVMPAYFIVGVLLLVLCHTFNRSTPSVGELVAFLIAWPKIILSGFGAKSP